MNPLYAATMNPICSGEAEIGGARAYRGMNRPDAEAAAFTRKFTCRGRTRAGSRCRHTGRTHQPSRSSSRSVFVFLRNWR
jgi:hypothetical protein